MTHQLVLPLSHQALPGLLLLLEHGGVCLSVLQQPDDDQQGQTAVGLGELQDVLGLQGVVPAPRQQQHHRLVQLRLLQVGAHSE